MTSLDRLNEDVFLEILSHFSSRELRLVIARISSEFREAAMADYLWERRVVEELLGGNESELATIGADEVFLQVLSLCCHPLLHKKSLSNRPVHVAVAQRMAESVADVTWAKERFNSCISMELESSEVSGMWFDLFNALATFKDHQDLITELFGDEGPPRVPKGRLEGWFPTPAAVTKALTTTLAGRQKLQGHPPMKAVKYLRKLNGGFPFTFLRPAGESSGPPDPRLLFDILVMAQLRHQVKESCYGMLGTHHIQAAFYIGTGTFVEAFMLPMFYFFEAADTRVIDPDIASVRPWIVTPPFRLVGAAIGTPLKFGWWLLTETWNAAGGALAYITGWTGEAGASQDKSIIANKLTNTSMQTPLPFVYGHWYDQVFHAGAIQWAAMAPWFVQFGGVALTATIARDAFCMNPWWWTRHNSWTHRLSAQPVYLLEEACWQFVAQFFVYVIGAAYSMPIAYIPAFLRSYWAFVPVALYVIVDRHLNTVSYRSTRPVWIRAAVVLAFLLAVRIPPEGAIEAAMVQLGIRIFDFLTLGQLTERLARLLLDDEKRLEGRTLCGYMLGIAVTTAWRTWTRHAGWKAGAVVPPRHHKHALSMYERGFTFPSLAFVRCSVVSEYREKVDKVIQLAWIRLQKLKEKAISQIVRRQNSKPAKSRTEADGKPTGSKGDIPIGDVAGIIDPGPRESGVIASELFPLATDERYQERGPAWISQERLCWGGVLLPVALAEAAIGVGALAVQLDTGRFWEPTAFRIAVGLVCVGQSLFSANC